MLKEKLSNNGRFIKDIYAAWSYVRIISMRRSGVNKREDFSCVRKKKEKIIII